jgi:HK97 family phage portal protein
MNILGLTITRRKGLSLRPLMSNTGAGSWWPIIRESFAGAWQSNVEVSLNTVATNPTLFACLTLIAGDIAKLCLRLVEQDADGVWQETTSPAFSPVLRKPNRYQTILQFIEQWMFSKLSRGNTYVLKQYDQRDVVTALYVLDPTRVTPLVTPDSAVYYEVRRDDLSEIQVDSLIVPASDIIHDRMNAVFHPLIGMSPIFACGIAALQGNSIQNNSQKFFDNGSNPSGFLTAPGAISDETAQRLKVYFDTNFSGSNRGKVAVGGDGLKYEPFSMTAVDSQLIDQLHWSDEKICSCFHVPPYMAGIGPPPPYANVEPLLQQYFAQCLQILLTSLEGCLDEGLGLGPQFGNRYGTEFDIDDLIWMDTGTRVTSAKTAIDSGSMSPDEARAKYFGLGPVPGGDTPYMQQQYWPLKQLAARDIPAMPTAPSAAGTPPVEAPMEPDAMDKAASFLVEFQKAMEMEAA